MIDILVDIVKSNPHLLSDVSHLNFHKSNEINQIVSPHTILEVDKVHHSQPFNDTLMLALLMKDANNLKQQKIN